MKIVLVCLLVSLSISQKCIALIHGMGDRCSNFSEELIFLNDKFEIQAVCINFHGGLNSIIVGMNSQSKKSYAKLKSSGCKKVYLVAISQGAVIANYIIANQNPDDFDVRGLTTFGGVNRGINSIANPSMNAMFSIGSSKMSFLNFSFKSYKRSIQNPNVFSQAKFMREAINDIEDPVLKTKENFLKLRKIILIGYSKENILSPYETAYFLWVNENKEKLSFKNDSFFNEDKLGILEQFAKGKLEVFQVEGDHGEFDMNVMIIACRKMLKPENIPNPDEEKTLEDIFDDYVNRVDNKCDIRGEVKLPSFLKVGHPNTKCSFSNRNPSKFGKINSPSEYNKSEKPHKHFYTRPLTDEQGNHTNLK